MQSDLPSAHDAVRPARFVWPRRVASAVLLLAVFAVFAVMVAIPRLAGATPYTVLTGSMRPTMPPGTLVVTRKVDVDSLAIGTAVTYQLASGRPEVVTHRIVTVGSNTKGDRAFIAQGDANTSPDPLPVLAVQIRGAVWYHIPYLGYLNSILSGRQHVVAVTCAVGALLSYAAYMFVTAAVERTRRNRRMRADARVSNAVRV